MWFCHSDDDGASWSRPVRTPLWGYPADVIELHDGRVLAVYGYRRDPWGVRGCISDDGVDWSLDDEFVIREGGAADPSVRQYWHIGYPTRCAARRRHDRRRVSRIHEGRAADPVHVGHPVPAVSDIEIVPLTADQWLDLKRLRIAALTESPDAFSPTAEDGACA